MSVAKFNEVISGETLIVMKGGRETS